MEENFDQLLCQLHLRFIGKIIASFTHEIKNHLAIIKESAGLMDDILRIGKSSESNSSQYLDIINSIVEQVDKSIGLFRFLNSFAHRMDNQFCNFHINESLEELIALMTRLANQKRISFEKSFDPELPELYNNPSLFQFVIFCYFERYIQQSGNGNSIIVTTEKMDDSVRISLSFKGDIINYEPLNDSSEIIYTIVKEKMKGEIEDKGNVVVMKISSISKKSNKS